METSLYGRGPYFDLTHCKVYEQRVSNMSEYEKMGEGRPFITLLRRGPWIADQILIYDKAAYAENWTPDWDLRGRYFASAYRYVLSSGASVNGTNTGAHDWTTDAVPTNCKALSTFRHYVMDLWRRALRRRSPRERSNAAAQALPVGHQVVTDFTSGDEIRLTQVIRSGGTTTDALTGDMLSKWEQTADPQSYAWAIAPTNLANATAYLVARGFVFQRGPGLGIDAVTLENWRNDLKTPATFSFVAGSSKTDAAGDYNTDGFNDRHGWYELNASDGNLSCSLIVGGVTRIMPVLRIWGLSAGGKMVKLNGATAAAGTDYVLEDMGDGNALLQILGTYGADLLIELSSPAVSAISTSGLSQRGRAHGND
jgi:hypothetical protein